MLNEPLYIRCKSCALKSCNPSDIHEKFCGHCHKFHKSDGDYELGPTIKSLREGFTCTRDGHRYYCPRPRPSHPDSRCPSCVEVIDDEVQAVSK